MMIKVKSIFLFILSIIFTTLNIHSQDLLNDKFVSQDFIYYFDKSDSTLYKYSNNKSIIYESPITYKAHFGINKYGFGNIRLRRAVFSKDKPVSELYDSIYIKLSQYDDKYVLEHFVIKNNMYLKERSDTVMPFKKALATNQYSLPFLSIEDLLSDQVIVLYDDSKIEWNYQDKVYFVNLEGDDKHKIDRLLNQFILNNQDKPQRYNSKNIWNVDGRHLNFRTNKAELGKIINELNRLPDKQLIKKVKDIKFDNSDFSNYLKRSIFYSHSGIIVYMDRTTRTLYGGRQINNIIEVDSSFIKYTVSNPNTTVTDTFKVICQKHADGFLLKYGQLKNKLKFDPFNRAEVDTIIPIDQAIINNILPIERIQIIDIITNSILFKFDVNQKTINLKGKNRSYSGVNETEIEKRINQFVADNFLIKANDRTYQIDIGLKDTNIVFKIGEKQTNKFLKELKRLCP